MTELLVMRHGEAEQQAARDRDRALTPRGELCAANAGKYLNKLGWQPDILLSSPYTRAQQTAQRVVTSLPGLAPVIVDELIPDHSPREVAEYLNGLTQARIMIVSHQPLVGTLLGWLLSSDLQQRPHMDTASLCLVTADGFISGGAEMIWHVHAGEYSDAL